MIRLVIYISYKHKQLEIIQLILIKKALNISTFTTILLMNEKIVAKIWWFASIMAIAMYVSYIDQIILNLGGQPWSIILPVITTINCTARVFYGFLKPTKDRPIIACNVPGIVLWIITAITAIIA